MPDMPKVITPTEKLEKLMKRLNEEMKSKRRPWWKFWASEEPEQKLDPAFEWLLNRPRHYEIFETSDGRQIMIDASLRPTGMSIIEWWKQLIIDTEASTATSENPIKLYR